jgi:hypothetical protein
MEPGPEVSLGPDSSAYQFSGSSIVHGRRAPYMGLSSTPRTERWPCSMGHAFLIHGWVVGSNDRGRGQPSGTVKNAWSIPRRWCAVTCSRSCPATRSCSMFTFSHRGVCFRLGYADWSSWDWYAGTTTMAYSVITIAVNPCGLPLWNTDLPLLIANQETPGSVPRCVTNQAPLKRTTCTALDQGAGVCAVHYGVSRKRSGSYTNAFDHGDRNLVR